MASKKPSREDVLDELRSLFKEMHEEFASYDPNVHSDAFWVGTGEPHSAVPVNFFDQHLYEQFNKLSEQLVKTQSVEHISGLRIGSLVWEAWREALDFHQLSQETFEQRSEAAIKKLRKSILAPVKSWLVYLPVHDLATNALPFQLGQVEFLIFSEAHKTDIQQRAQHGQSLLTIQDINESNINMWIGQPVLSVKVEAIDEQAAVLRAARVGAQACDILNFYNTINEMRLARISLNPSMRTTLLVPVVSNDDPQHLYIQRYLGFRGAVDIAELKSEPNVSSSIFRINQFLTPSKEKGDPIPNRILTAIQWAGRAVTAEHQEVQFTNYITALEALLMERDPQSDITQRFALRIAHLLGTTLSERQELLSEASEFYKLRSKIVHNGSFELIGSEVFRLHSIVVRCIQKLLLDESFQSKGQFENLTDWFRERILEAPPFNEY